jgi:hypothetical protein
MSILGDASHDILRQTTGIPKSAKLVQYVGIWIRLNLPVRPGHRVFKGRNRNEGFGSGRERSHRAPND